MYADDLGYGDISCYESEKVETPNIDKIAQNGIQFTRAHSTAATCTPSRYSLLTGEYPWRREDARIASGEAPLIIEPEKTTLPDILNKANYKSGIVGKWHLGLGEGDLNWNKKIKPGPPEVGFNYSYIIPATGDRVPCVYVKDHHVVGLEKDDTLKVSYQEKVGDEPTGLNHPELLKMEADTQHSGTIINGISRIGYMDGAESARWDDEERALKLKNKACSFIERNKNNPFFLYYSFHNIHVPRTPNEKFVGKTDLGPRGDAIAELDWCVGEVIKKLEELDLTENTIVIFTSDNGPVLNDGYEDQSRENFDKNKISGPWKSGKYSSYEGGTTIPFLMKWPRKIKPNQKNDALISQVDLMTSFAELLDIQVENDEALDSEDILSTLLGKNNTGREYLVEQALGGHLALRTNQWKYIPPGQGPKYVRNLKTGRSSKPQLFNITEDMNEKNNVADKYPEVLSELKNKLDKIKSKEN